MPQTQYTNLLPQVSLTKRKISSQNHSQFHKHFQLFNSMASKSASTNSKSQGVGGGSRKCLCSPTTHPGSFRCSFHRSRRKVSARSSSSVAAITTVQLELAMFAKANALRAFLLQIIKPSSNDLQRRRNFHPRPSRFCLMNDHGSGLAVSLNRF